MAEVDGGPTLPTLAPDGAAPLVDDAVHLALRWAAATARTETAVERSTTGRLAAMVGDPAGLDLAVNFVDRVIRPEDDGVAARELNRLATTSAGFLGPVDRILLRLGGLLAPSAPGLVVPLARRRLRRMVGHLVVDGRDPALARHLARARGAGFRLNLNLLGEAVLGEGESARRASRTAALLARPDVDYVSVKVSSLVSQISPWDTAGSRDRVLERLRPVFRAAAHRTPRGFVNLDMEEYRDLDLTLAVFTAILAEPEFRDLEAGIALQAYLPDTLHAFERLLAFARHRGEGGGARVKVRLVKGANLAMERVEAELRGWTPAPYPSKADVDANYVRLLDVALRPDVTESVRVGVASHNLFDVALAHLLARSRGVEEALDVEMLQGMAPAQARAVQADVGRVVLYTPVVAPDDFDVAVAYLVRRLEENASTENFLHALVGRHPRRALVDQEARFRRSVADLARIGAEPRRLGRQQRPGPSQATTPATPRPAFFNATDTDPALAESRRWALAALAAPPRVPRSELLQDPAAVDAVVERAGRLAEGWGGLTPASRAAVLRTAADALEARRADLVTAMVHEGGKTIAEADPEVSEAVDLARYYALCAEDLATVDGARFVPDRLTVVTPPWNFPVAIPMGSALAALAAGSAVVLKPAPATPVCAEVAGDAVRQALDAHGIAPDVLQVVRTDEGDVGRRLVTHPAVDAVVLTGSIETARLFASWRPDLRLIAETSGKNAIVVTPAADLDLAVADVVRSAFGHAGQKCSAASLVIAVGSVGTSARFRRQLADAVGSLRVAWPEDPGAGMGPLIEPPTGKLHRALTHLDPGERWLVEPRSLDGSDRLWTPGVKEGVSPGSFFHLTECFGPVLGILTAGSLDEAVALQNATPFGLTGGLHSLDEAEVERWLERVEVGNAYVNRHITGAIVRRQPFGGWKASSVGPGAKAGGPNYVAQLGEWVETLTPQRVAAPEPRIVRGLERLAPLLDGPRAPSDVAWLRAAVGSDARVWAEDLGREHDPTGLAAESNVLRYRPLPEFVVRAGPGCRWAEVVRVLLAAALVGTPAQVSAAPVVVSALAEVRDEAGLEARRALARTGLRVETDVQLIRRLAASTAPARVRAIGDAGGLREAAADAGITVIAGAVLASGRRELLSVLREQAVSVTRHRFGDVAPGRGVPPA